MARWLDGRGWLLRSGGARGADSAFAAGCPGLRVFRPEDAEGRTWAESLFREVHPAPHRCSSYVKLLHMRNAMIVLGENGSEPVDAVVCWSQGGKAVGGTGVAMMMAESNDIPVLNLATISPREVCEKLLAMERGTTLPHRNVEPRHMRAGVGAYSKEF